MARTIWKNRSWLRKFACRPWTPDAENVPLDHGLFPQGYFQEKLLQERKRALRSNKPLVVMVLNAECMGDPDNPGRITQSLGEALNGCVRDSDICGLLREDELVGVILTEVEVEKVDTVQQIVAKKTRERLDARLSHEMANRVAITFRIFPVIDGRGLQELNLPMDLVAPGGHPKG
jgi:hypothetical protein